MNLVSRSLRLKVSLGVSLALILLLTPFNWLQYQLQRRAALADLSQLAVTTGAVAEHSLEGAMLANNRPAIQNIVDSVAQAPDVQSVLLLNPQAIVAASPGGKFNGQPLDRAERGVPGLPSVTAGGPAAQHRGEGGRRPAGIPHHDPHRQSAGVRRLSLAPGSPERGVVR